MKKIILSIALLFFVHFCYSQTKEDYSSVLNTLKDAFNAKNVDQVYNLFSSDLKSSLSKEKLSQLFKDTHADKGAMGDSELILEEDSSNRYLTDFENASMLIVLKLTSEGKLSVFSIEEY
ncbi:DUF3887 domain-containing protein [Tenacibaculum sp. MEBiC06402]|uniref:DUF3887 domain-containing protein n=1 Tax=unclassified Tenacibaculum TaxID=2635139 RepID=UPI003B99C3DA